MSSTHELLSQLEAEPHLEPSPSASKKRRRSDPEAFEKQPADAEELLKELPNLSLEQIVRFIPDALRASARAHLSPELQDTKDVFTLLHVELNKLVIGGEKDNSKFAKVQDFLYAYKYIADMSVGESLVQLLCSPSVKSFETAVFRVLLTNAQRDLESALAGRKDLLLTFASASESINSLLEQSSVLVFTSNGTSDEHGDARVLKKAKAAKEQKSSLIVLERIESAVRAFLELLLESARALNQSKAGDKEKFESSTEPTAAEVQEAEKIKAAEEEVLTQS